MRGLNQDLAAGHLSPRNFSRLGNTRDVCVIQMGIMAGAHYTLAVQDCQKIDLDYILP